MATTRKTTKKVAKKAPVKPAAAADTGQVMVFMINPHTGTTVPVHVSKEEVPSLLEDLKRGVLSGRDTDKTTANLEREMNLSADTGAKKPMPPTTFMQATVKNFSDLNSELRTIFFRLNGMMMRYHSGKGVDEPPSLNLNNTCYTEDLIGIGDNTLTIIKAVQGVVGELETLI